MVDEELQDELEQALPEEDAAEEPEPAAEVAPPEPTPQLPSIAPPEPTPQKVELKPYQPSPKERVVEKASQRANSRRARLGRRPIPQPPRPEFQVTGPETTDTGNAEVMDTGEPSPQPKTPGSQEPRPFAPPNRNDVPDRPSSRSQEPSASQGAVNGESTKLQQETVRLLEQILMATERVAMAIETQGKVLNDIKAGLENVGGVE